MKSDIGFYWIGLTTFLSDKISFQVTIGPDAGSIRLNLLDVNRVMGLLGLLVVRVRVFISRVKQNFGSTADRFGSILAHYFLDIFGTDVDWF